MSVGVTKDYALEKAYHCDGRAGEQLEDVGVMKDHALEKACHRDGRADEQLEDVGCQSKRMSRSWKKR